MNPLAGKKILLGITASIAAYKAAVLARLIIKAGADVQVIMTDTAKAFITPLTLATLSRRPVLSSLYHEADGTWSNHVELGLWADAMLIAPASANTLGKAAHGISDNLLLTTYLSARCPVFWAPAMDLDMYQHAAVKGNMVKLQSFGDHIIPAGTGELASGLEGQGRLAEPEEIVAYLARHFSKSLAWAGQKVLITAGPTQEAIDPVRYISNHSSGKMGYAIAAEILARGGQVELITGPTHLPKPTGANIHPVTSALEMANAVANLKEASTGWIFSAAVADYTPADPKEKKWKSGDATPSILLAKTQDIAQVSGSTKRDNQWSVGFALETDNEETNALGKLEKKNLDFVVLNSLRDEGAGFQVDTNKVTIMKRDGQVTALPLLSKNDVAARLCDEIEKVWH